jgi:pimeloyl-ACP methyl ester carboxylesterase
MPERVDLGPCRAILHEESAERWAVLLPGMVYPTRAPVLWFARQTAMALGYSALEILGEPVEQADQVGWLRACAAAAIDQVGSSRVVVIGKSLAGLLAGEISERNLPAAWLTPPLTERAMIAALSRVREPTLLLGGSADAMWKREAIPENPVLEIVELPNVDHGLQVAGDTGASLEALRQMNQALSDWLTRLPTA